MYIKYVNKPSKISDLVKLSLGQWAVVDEHAESTGVLAPYDQISCALPECML
jgi:hypothetical protein